MKKTKTANLHSLSLAHVATAHYPFSYCAVFERDISLLHFHQSDMHWANKCVLKMKNEKIFKKE